MPSEPRAARSRLIRGLTATTALAGLLAVAPAMAQTPPPTLPGQSDGDVASGIAFIDKPDSATLNIRVATPRAVINWTSFDIGLNETANFSAAIPPVTGGPLLPASVSVLNRVTGNDGPIAKSQILGNLNSGPDVSVYLVNPEGVVFGADSQVTVGSLVASTRDITDNDFGLGTLRFAGSSIGEIQVLPGAKTFAASNGIVALIGARIDVDRTITTTTGEIVLVAADNTTISYDGASPLRIQIDRGTRLAQPMLVRGTLEGSSVLLAAATQTDVNATLLDVQAVLTATTAFPSDQGIVLAAGRPAGPPSGPDATSVTMPVPGPREPLGNQGPLSLSLGGVLTANGDAGSIDVRSRLGIESPETAATLTAAQAVRVGADAGNVRLGAVTATAGTLAATATGLLALASGLSGGDMTLRATGALSAPGTLSSTAGTVDAQGATLSVGDALAGGDVLLTSTGGALEVTRVQAGQTATLIASGSATVGSLGAGGNGSISAGDVATLSGGGTVGYDLSVSGAEVRLGGGTGVQQAGHDARYTAGVGGITAVVGGGITIRADALSPPTAAGAIILEGRTGIALAGIGLVTGSPSGMINTGDVSVQPGTGQALTLGTIDARALLGAGSGGSDVTLGATRLTRSLDLATSGAVSLASLAIAAPGQTLGVSGSAVSATGTLRAPVGVTVTAPGLVSLANVAAGTGAATLRSTAGESRAGAVGGGTVTASAQGALTLGAVDATAGAAMLTSVSGALAVGDTNATGDVTIFAPGEIRTGDVTSGGTVLFQPTTSAATGAVVAGSIQAAGNLTVTRPTALTFAGVRSGGSVTLNGTGVVTVTNAAVAGTSVSVTGANPTGVGVTLGSVDARNGAATLTATRGGITVGGATTATGTVTLDAPGAITLGDVRSSGGTVIFRSTAIPVVGAIRAGQVQARNTLTVDRAAGLTFTGAVSDFGAVSLSSTGGTVAVDGSTRAATGVAIDAAAVRLQDVTANGGAASLVARTGALTAGAVVATGTSGFVYGSAGNGLSLASAAASERVELLTDSGRIDVAGAIGAGTYVSVNAASGAEIGSVGTSGSATSTLRVRGGALTVRGATLVSGPLNGQATGDIGLRAVTSTGGSVTLASRDGRVDTTGISARTSVDVSGQGALTLGDVTGREGSVSLVSRGDRIGVGQVTAGTTLLADASAALSLESAAVGGSATLAGSEIVLGPITAGSLSATARGGGATIGTIDTSGTASVTATGAAILPRAITAGGDLTVRGGSVTLGSAGNLVSQVAAGSIGVTSTGGAITGLSGLTLRSDTGSAGGSDVALQSAGGIAFGANTLIAGGGDRQSAVRLGAASSANIALDAVEARTITSPGVATLSYGGPLSINRAATRDTLSIGLTGAGNALTLGTAEVRAGDLSLISRGIISTGALTAAAGATTLDGTAVTGGAIVTRGLVATAGTGAVTLGTANATAGGVTITAATDVLLPRVTATGGIALTSTAGDVTGPGATPIALTAAGAVTVRANAVDGIRGVMLLGTASGIAGVDLFGRTITAERLVSSGGGVTASTRPDLAAITDQRMTIGTIDAAGAITLATGNGAAASNGALTLDRGTAGRDISISTIGGGLAARSGSPRTVLAAPGGAVALDIGGAALLDSVNGRSVTIAATNLEATTATAGAGGLSVTTGTDLRIAVATSVGDSRLTAGRALSVDTAMASGALALTGATVGARTITAGSLTAVAGTGGYTSDTANVTGAASLRSGAGIALGTLDAAAVTATAAGSIAATRIAARAGDTLLSATVGDVRLGAVSASGAVTLTSSGASVVTGAATAGAAYRIDAASIALGTTNATARQSAGEIALTARSGTIAVQGSTTLAAARAVALTADGTGGALTLAPDTSVTSSAADVTLATRGVAALGTVGATAGAIRLSAADAALTRPVSAQAVTLTNVAAAGVTRLGDTGVGNETEFGTPATRFDLTNAEIGLVAAPTVTIASGARDVMVGAVGLAATTGATRFAITADGRIDMLGRFVAAGSQASRTIAIGNEAVGTAARTAVIRLAATQGEGGRLAIGDAVLALSADRIGGGLDRDSLDAIGYRTTTGLGVEQVTREYVARPTSTLYNASALGAAPYTDTVLVQAGALRLSYGRYALFQNTGRVGEQRGVVIGSTLALAAPGGTANTFGLFGTIDGISSSAAALLGPDRLAIDSSVSPVSSRINGCVIGSGAGCLNTSIAQPTLNLFDTSRAEIVRTADDLSLPFDPLIGTNNEALYLDAAADGAAPECEGDKPCPATP